MHYLWMNMAGVMGGGEGAGGPMAVAPLPVYESLSLKAKGHWDVNLPLTGMRQHYLCMIMAMVTPLPVYDHGDGDSITCV